MCTEMKKKKKSPSHFCGSWSLQGEWIRNSRSNSWWMMEPILAYATWGAPVLPLRKWMSLSPEAVAWMELLGPFAQEEFLVLGLNRVTPKHQSNSTRRWQC